MHQLASPQSPQALSHVLLCEPGCAGVDSPFHPVPYSTDDQARTARWMVSLWMVDIQHLSTCLVCSGSNPTSFLSLMYLCSQFHSLPWRVIRLPISLIDSCVCRRSGVSAWTSIDAWCFSPALSLSIRELLPGQRPPRPPWPLIEGREVNPSHLLSKHNVGKWQNVRSYRPPSCCYG